MTTLYRSHNVIIDRHEWYTAVLMDNKRRVTQSYYWRPLSSKAFRWLPRSRWKGPMPKRFANNMQMFRPHVRVAMLTEVRRREAILALEARKGPATAAAVLNVDHLAQAA